MTKSNRSFIAQLRSSILPIDIEIGRFQQKSVEERLCPGCTEKSVEDEIHSIFHCPLYAGIRIVFMRYVQNIYPDIHTKGCLEKLSIFMNDIQIINKCSAFICDCYFKRDNFFICISTNLIIIKDCNVDFSNYYINLSILYYYSIVLTHIQK